MTIGERIKLVRGDMAREKFAPLTGIVKNTLVNYETDVSSPQAEYLNRLLALFPELSPAWLLTGEGAMRRTEVKCHVANGNNIIQGSHIGAEDVHLVMAQPTHSADSGASYADPIDGVFLKDWKGLSDIGKMRVWTLLKEEIQKEKDNREG